MTNFIPLKVFRNKLPLKGKTVAVTGSTGGLGSVLCKKLLQLGAALVLIDRNPAKAQALIAALKKQLPNAQITALTADLAEFSSVKAVAERLIRLAPDYLIHNAGAYKIPRIITDIGYDNVFTINFISPYYLIRRLLEAGCQTAFVAVSSIANNYSEIDEADIDFRSRTAASKVYGNAKRYLTYALYALCEGSERLSIVHPGITFTNITNHYNKYLFMLIKYPMQIIFMPPKLACHSILSGIFNKTDFGYWIGPAVCDIWGSPRRRKLRGCHAEEAKKIADIADAIYQKLG